MDEKSIYREFSAFGLALKRDAMKLLCSYLDKTDDPEDTLQLILQRLPSIHQDSLITKEVIDELVKTLKKSASPTHHVFAFQSAFDIPKYVFDNAERSYIPAKKENANQPNAFSVLGKSTDKISVYQERYQILKTCLNHTSTFHASSVQFGIASSKSYSITPIASLISLGDESVILLGYLDSDSSTVTLEDPTGIVPIDIESVKEHLLSGIFSVGNIVVVQADYHDGVVYCSLIGHPPAQTATSFFQLYWKVHNDPFGWDITKETSIELQELLKTQHENSLVTVFSDVWIDVPAVLDNFNEVLSKYDKCPPNIMIICGSFTSRPFSFDQFATFTKLFTKFCDTIKLHKTIYDNTQICIVPSLNDLGSAHVYPRPAFPESLAHLLENAHFMTNPCRIRFLNQTITIFRDDLLKRMANSAVFQVPETDAHNHLLTTIIDQRHLCPVDLEHAPIAWQYDHSLRLFPPPNVLALCDSCQAWTSNYADCHAFNPGQFGSNGTYAQYFPAEGRAEIFTPQ
ncbi:DNA polymerase epsilon subunit 2 [Tritrichomonas foetus]|uniref:DNA polymerase epsilon subunit n=1 Tax=Tritrichomonas foetus TaxID=1144522 RepID=A0A1J4J728_9EUKA|nr:DNA polymerase epsilon subunit 2 [Tritrichomonas foetus]|eukprot:OHS95026.1 DNA polymerase epsilon subunit 2 [Tritrichomonas foetus]